MKIKVAVALHDLVTPAYLIEVEVKQNEEEIVKILYNILKVLKFSKRAITKIKPQSLSKVSTVETCLKTTSDYTAEKFCLELEAEINLN